MRVKGITFVGARTPRLAEMERLFGETMGLVLKSRAKDMVIWQLPDGSLVEVFSEDEPDHLHFDSGPVVGFLVDDVAAARAELEAAGHELIGPMHTIEERRGWTFFRAPDGNVYEITGPISGPGDP
ncbi:MAG TPA: VOC family protein [Actinomycetes bacterium]|jgi:catechol 2,3-dioxygenase-like lactoylglutathione lyase family enzyme|nr:VOC family protein [Actinomycetes bacterium]